MASPNDLYNFRYLTLALTHTHFALLVYLHQKTQYRRDRCVVEFLMCSPVLRVGWVFRPFWKFW